MNEKFTKRVMKWGLLRKAAGPSKPWCFVNFVERLYNNGYTGKHKRAPVNRLKFRELAWSIVYFLKALPLTIDN